METVYGTYNLPLVVVSILVAIAASYAAFDFTGRVNLSKGSVRLGWIICGAVTMSLGIWSMHYIGMLAFHLPIHIYYNIGLVVLSLLFAVSPSFLAFSVISRENVGISTLLYTGGLLGFSIASMHYIGMAAIQTKAILHFDLGLFSLSFLIGVLASTIALWVAFYFKNGISLHRNTRKLIGSSIIGVAIAGMHYTTMETARLMSTHGQVVQFSSENINPEHLGILVGISTSIIIGLVVLGAFLDRQTALRFSQETMVRYLSLFEHNLDAVYTVDSRGVLQSVNAATIQVTGYSEDELLQMPFKQFIIEKDLQRVLDVFTKVVQGEAHNEDISIFHKKGHIIRLNVTNVPIVIDNQIVGICGIARDITERNTLVESLQTAEQDLKDTVREQQGMTFKVKKERGRFIYTMCDGELLYRLGYRPECVIGEEPINIVGLETAATITEYYSRAWEGEENVLYENESNGITYVASLRPIKRNGRIVEVIASCVDITERKLIEKALLESEKQLRTLINVVPDAIVLKDGEGRWLEANEVALHVLQLSDVPYIGKTDAELAEVSSLRQEAFLGCQGSDERTWIAGVPTSEEETISHLDGGDRCFEVIKVPVFGLDGDRKSLLIISRDITERKWAEELLRKSDKLAVVGQLAAGVAHEIRNPLQAVRGFVQLLQSSSTENLEYFPIILRELDRIGFIISEFLILAKPQVLKLHQKDMQDLFHSVIALLETQAIFNNIEIVSEFHASVPLVTCEENHLKQVFTNVLKNGIESMPTGGTIRIIVTMPDENNVNVCFTDQGSGISEERLAKLGEPFYTTKEMGTGLGLMICFKIVENHGGTMKISSQLGEGTTVEITLPIE